MQSHLSSRSFAVRLVPVLVACTPLLLPSPVRAQTRTVAAAEIPFEFAIGKDKLPAGSYRIVKVTQDLMRIETTDRKAMKNVTVYAVSATKAPEQGRLVFHRYGNQYFLANCWLANNNSGFQLLRSKAEKETMLAVADAARTADMEVALNGASSR